MKNRVLYFIICFSLFSCENKNKLIDHSDDRQLLLHHVEDSILFHAIFSEEVKIQDTLSVKDTIPYSKIIEILLIQEKRKELIEFCDLFVSTIQSTRIEKIKNVIDFPIWVECFEDSTRGDTITVDNFFQYRQFIFDNIFFKSVRECKAFFNKEIDEEDVFEIGTSYFFIATTYIGEEAEKLGLGGRTRVFRFEEKDNKYKLVLVFCIGG